MTDPKPQPPPPIGALAIHLLLLASGCTIVGPGDDLFDVEPRTDKLEYIVGHAEKIHLRVTIKAGSRSVHYPCSVGIDLQELDGQTVTKEWNVRGVCQSLATYIVPAGEELTMEISISAIRAENAITTDYLNYPSATFDRSVDYRLVVGLYTDLSFNRLIPIDERVSNRFKIVAANGSVTPVAIKRLDR